MNAVFSSKAELTRLAATVVSHCHLPFAGRGVSGGLLEAALADVRAGKVLETYDYVDVINTEARVGWSVKSTKADTPLTWKRAKIANKAELIELSHSSPEGAQHLGNVILEFCNAHARQSLEKHNLAAIGYARLIIQPGRKAFYFERVLCTTAKPAIFDPRKFKWSWSNQRENQKKESLPALHGTEVSTGKRWWAWHGLGENQLHFTGERAWWPQIGDQQAIAFDLPALTDRLTVDEFNALIESRVKSS